MLREPYVNLKLRPELIEKVLAKYVKAHKKYRVTTAEAVRHALNMYLALGEPEKGSKGKGSGVHGGRDTGDSRRFQGRV